MTEAVQRWIVPWVLDDVELGDDVIEVGSGPGATTDVVRLHVARLTAVDLDPSLAANLAKRLAGGNVRVVNADATATDVPSGSFSGAVTMLRHLPTASHQDALVAELHRLLRPGGVLAGTDTLDSPGLRDLRDGDTCVPVGPGGLAQRLAAVGDERIDVETNDDGVRFRAYTPG